jgi:excisionase family DNA binding protein
VTPLLDLKSAAAVLGVSPDTLRHWCYAGKCPHRKIGGRIRFTEQDLAEYVESCAVGVRGVPEPRVIAGGIKPLKYYLELGRSNGVKVG